MKTDKKEDYESTYDQMSFRELKTENNYQKLLYHFQLKKMKKYLDETRTKYEEEVKILKQYQELNKQDNRKTLEPAQKKKLTQKLEESEKTVQTLKELIDKITEYSGLK